MLKFDKATITLISVIVTAIAGGMGKANLSDEIADIRERLARIETTIELQNRTAVNP
jgi:hypothetical protein